MLVQRLSRSYCRRGGSLRAYATVSAPKTTSRGWGFSSAAAVAGALAAGGWYVYDGKEIKAVKTVVPPTAALPLVDTESRFPFKFSTPPSPEEVTEILGQNTWSYTSTGLSGVARCDGAQLPSNGRIEDRFLCGKFASPVQGTGPATSDWLAVGVFDGHCGAETADAVSKSLMSYVNNYLRQVGPSTDGASIDAAIEKAFVALDDTFIKHVRETLDDDNMTFAEKVLRLTPASNGSCALLSLFDPSTRTVRIACTGDSRAVVGYQTEDGKWELAHATVDQNIHNAVEMERVKQEHPGEDETLVKGSYYMGLQPTRVFGDARQKWPLEAYNESGQKYNTNYYGRKRPLVPTVYKTPPYHTAQPVVTTVRLDKGRPAFLIVATDGLWDTMSSEQAVGLVGRWHDWVKAGRPAAKDGPPDFGRYDLTDNMKNPYEERKAVVHDDNAAVHLIRNGLGGRHHDMISGLLAFKPPYSRDVRDDMTVQVVFFDG